MAVCEQALALDSADEELWVFKASMHLRRKEYSEALSCYNAALTLGRDEVSILEKVASLQVILQQYQNAISSCNSILNRDEKNPEALLLKAIA